MGTINQLARGLQGLLTLRGAGETPKEWAEFLQPTLDMEKYYSIQQIRSRGNTNAALALGTTIGVTVPAGEVWLPYAVHGRITSGTNQSFGIVIELLGVPVIGGGVSFTGLASGVSSSNMSSGELFYVPWQPPQGFFLTGGNEIRMRITENNGGFTLAVANFQIIYAQLSVGPGTIGAGSL